MYKINHIWYNHLIKSSLTPSVTFFPIAWSIIYITIIASFLVFISKGIDEKKFIPIIVFFIQIILNLIWPPIFFIANSLIFSFIIILLLTITIGLNIILFWKHSKIAACFLIPYFLWIIFANYLNFELIRLNMF